MIWKRIKDAWRRLPELFKAFVMILVVATAMLVGNQIIPYKPKLPPTGVAYEDFLNDYTMQDGSPSCLTRNTTDVVVENLERDDDVWVYKDFGSGHFTNFTHKFEVRGRDSDATSGNDIWYCWLLTHDVSDTRAIDVELEHSYIGFRLQEFASADPDNPQVMLQECDNGTLYSDTDDTWVAIDTWYYVTIVKSGKELYSEIRTGSHTGTLKDNFTLTLKEDYAFQYLYSVNGYNSAASTREASGNIRNMDIGEEAAEVNSITLNSPANNFNRNNTKTINFQFTPYIYGVGIINASLHVNDTEGWNTPHWNTSAIVNGSSNTIQYTVNGSWNKAWKWNIRVFNKTSELATWADANFTLEISRVESIVVLNEPSDNSVIGKQLQITFNFTPMCYWGNIKNCSLHINDTNGWNTAHWNTTVITNNTINSIEYTVTNYGNYIWNVRMFNKTTEDTFWASSNFTLTLEDYFLVTHSIDDSSYNNDEESWDVASTALKIYAHDGGTESYYDMGVLFQVTEIQQGATINEANVTLYAYSTTVDSCDFTIYGNDVNDADTFNHGTKINARTRTTASHTYTTDNLGIGWHDFNVTDSMQEIINREGWTIGNNMSFLFIATNTSYDRFYSYSYDQGTYIPRLYVDYTINKPNASQASATPETGAMNNFTMKWTANSGSMDNFRLGHNGSGSLVWGAWESFDGSTYSNTTTNVGWLDFGQTLEWKIEANNTGGYSRVSDAQTFIVKEINYGTKHQLQVDSLTNDLNSSGSVHVAENIYFNRSSGDGWEEWDIPDVYTDWVSFVNIQSHDSNWYLKAIEFEYYTGAAWRSPDVIVSYCGVTGFNYGTNFIDGDIGTYWQHETTEGHDIKIQLYTAGTYDTVEKIRVWVNSTDDDTMFYDVGSFRARDFWNSKGVSPYLDSTSYDNQIHSGGSNTHIGHFNFENLTGDQTVVDIKLEIEYKGDLQINYTDDHDKQVLKDVDASILSWTTTNVTFQHLHDTTLINTFECSIKSVENNTCVNYMQLHCTTETINQTIRRIFDTEYNRRVNNTFPFSREFNEEDETWGNLSIPLLLSGSIYYELTGNISYLNKAEKLADWLNNTSTKKHFFGRYNHSSSSWLNEYHAGSVGWTFPLYDLGMLANKKAEWRDLLQEIVDLWIDMFVNHTGSTITYMIYNKVDNSNEPISSTTNSIMALSEAASLGYAGWVLDNDTIIDLALQCFLSYPLGTYNLPAHTAYLFDGSAALDYAKTTTTGAWMLSASQLYYISKNTTLKDTWQTVAEYACHYSWNDTYYAPEDPIPNYLEQISGETRGNSTGWDGQFEYRTEIDTGHTGWDGMVKGKWYFMEGIIHSYLLFGNQTWLDRLATELHFTFINGTDRAGSEPYTNWNYGSQICHDIMFHGSVGFAVTADGGNFQDSDLRRTASALRTLQLMYNLNATANFECQHTSGQIHSLNEQKWLDAYKNTYHATMSYHKGKYGLFRSKFFTKDDEDIKLTNVDNTMTLPSNICFRYFMNKTSTINVFSDIYEKWGNPWTGEAAPTSPISANQWTTITLWSVDYGKTFLQVNSSLTHDSLSYTYFAVYFSNGTVYGGFEVGQDWNLALTIPASETGMTLRIWATAAGSWSHTYV